MKKKDWGNATWYLFHTLAQKLKPEYAKDELPILFGHIETICNNLPCPDCQEHARNAMLKVNKRIVTSSKENLINYLWSFHNSVNLRTNKPFYPKESLEMYNRAITPNVVKNFINIMSQSLNSSKMMTNTFHRQRANNQFINYISNNYYKYS